MKTLFWPNLRRNKRLILSGIKHSLFCYFLIIPSDFNAVGVIGGDQTLDKIEKIRNFPFSFDSKETIMVDKKLSCKLGKSRTKLRIAFLQEQAHYFGEEIDFSEI